MFPVKPCGVLVGVLLLVPACQVLNPNYMPRPDQGAPPDLTGAPPPDLTRADLAGADLRSPPADLQGTVSPTDACNAMASAHCTQLNACNPFALLLDYTDVATCIARTLIHCTGRFSLPGVTLTPALLKTCAAAYTTLSCDDFLMGNLPAPCQFTGTLNNTSKCGDNAQCLSGYCSKGDAASCGQCSDRVSAGVQCACTIRSVAVDDCTDTACQYGLYCPPSGSPDADHCVMPAGSGATCAANKPCKPTLACVGGKCGTPLTVGTTCAVAGFQCDQLHGQFCAATNNLCAAAPPTAAPSAACNAMTVCTGSSVCNGTTCAPPVADGAMCNAGLNEVCQAPAACSPATSTCAIVDPATCI